MAYTDTFPKASLGKWRLETVCVPHHEDSLRPARPRPRRARPPSLGLPPCALARTRSVQSGCRASSPTCPTLAPPAEGAEQCKLLRKTRNARTCGGALPTFQT